jgi:hypothetical protein
VVVEVVVAVLTPPTLLAEVVVVRAVMFKNLLVLRQQLIRMV